MPRGMTGTSGMLKKGSVLEDIVNNRSYYLILLPGLIYFIIFKYLPMLGIVIAFKDFDMFAGIFNSDWVGLKHFKMLFSSESFFKIFRNTLIISTYKIIFNFPVPIILAVMLNEIKSRVYKRTLQTVVYFPYFLSWVVVTGIVFNLLSPANGVVNMVIKSLGHEPVNFLIEKSMFRSIIVLSDLWYYMGWNSIVYLAAISCIDPQLYEAAFVEGASRLKCIFYITIPSIKSTIIVMLLIRIGNIMNTGFEQIFLLYNPMVYEVSDVFETYVYRIGLVDNRYDYATAVGLFKSIVALIFLASANTFARKIGEEGIY